MEQTYEALKIILEDDETFNHVCTEVFKTIDIDNSGSLEKNEIKLVAEKFDRRTKEGKEAAARFEEANQGKIVITSEEMATLKNLARLARAVKAEHPGALVTYVNFPTTEYLQLPFVDIVSFNVYLESRETLEPYLPSDRGPTATADRPLLRELVEGEG